MELLLSEGPIQVFADKHTDRPTEFKVLIDGEGTLLTCTYLSTVESYLRALTSYSAANEMIKRLRCRAA